MRFIFGDNQRYDGFKIGIRLLVMVMLLIHVYMFHWVTLEALDGHEMQIYSILHWI